MFIDDKSGVAWNILIQSQTWQILILVKQIFVPGHYKKQRLCVMMSNLFCAVSLFCEDIHDFYVKTAFHSIKVSAHIHKYKVRIMYSRCSIISKYLCSKVHILSYKINIFTFTKIVFKKRWLCPKLIRHIELNCKQ